MKKLRNIAGYLMIAVLIAAVPLVWATTIDDNMKYTGTVTHEGTVVLTDATITGTGKITATHIADPTRSIPFQLAAASFNNAGTINVIGNDGTTAPGIAAVDLVPAIVYASSAEVASIGWTFVVPPNYSSGLAFRMLISSSSDTASASIGFDWNLFVNNFSTAFDATAYEQTAVANTTDNPSTSNVLLTFTADATAAADIAAGDVVTVWFWNNDSRVATATTEVKAVEARYTATQ
jgi:hypothetical protein